jgi:putative peptidoglycan lipid II flippase
VNPTPRAGKSALVRSSAAVATGTALSRVTGLIRVAALAWALGGGTLSDTYNLANTLPNIVYELVLGGVLAATIVPVFVRLAAAGDERSTSAVVTITTTVLVAFTALALLCTPLFARLFAISTTGAERDAQLRVATILTLCFLPQMIFYGITAIATALLNAHRRFVAAAYAPVVNNVVVIVMLAVFAAQTSHNRAAWTDAARVRNELGLLLLLGIGTTAGVVAMAFVLFPAIRRARIHLRPVFSWRDAGVRTIVRLSGWTLGYVATNQLAQLFVLVLAKTGGSGDVTAYVYAFTFYVLPHSLLAVSIMTTMSPELAQRAADDDMPGLRRDFKTGLRYLIVLVLPASVAFTVLAQPIIGVLHIGKFSGHTAMLTADILQCFAVSLVPFSVYLYTMRAFYALQDTRTPFFLNAFENALNIGFAVALFPTFGVQGLAMAWSAAYLIAAIAALFALARRIGPAVDAGVGRALLQSAAGAVALAIVAAPLAGAIGRETAARALVAALVAGLVGSACYVGVLALVHSEELASLTDMLRRRRRATPADVSP